MSSEALDRERGRILLALARAALEKEFGRRSVTRPRLDWLAEPGACFVTLRQGAELRGCIGSVVAHRSLAEDVTANALAAAFHDPRFLPLTEDELDTVTIEVSVLSLPTAIEFGSERDLLNQLRPGEDGVILEMDTRRATFLPAVWKQLPDPTDFLRKLKRKAGLEETFWSEEIRIQRYTTESWSEVDPIN